MKEKQESPRRRCLLILIEKIPNAMKLTFLFLVISLLSFTATASAQRVSITLENAKVVKVLAAITDQTGFNVAYSKQVVDVDRRVSLNFTNAELTQVLDKLTEGTLLGYEVNGGKIYLFNRIENKPINQQSKKITGQVTDQNGEPIIGANVIVKGSTTGTITDLDGNYSIEASSSDILLISYIGYNTKEIAVKNQSTVDIKLVEDTQNLDEVVVVGYGVQKKVNMTGSISNVKSEELSVIPNTNLSNSLAGRAPGATITGNSGLMGASSEIRMRGGFGDPLFVIDGVIRDKEAFDNLEPYEIDQMSFLKDAASASIYGSAAGNGVVLVTTKGGVKNQKPVFNYQGSYAFSKPTQELFADRWTAIDDLDYQNAVARFQGTKEPNGEAEYAYFRDNNINYNVNDYIWQNPWNTKHSLSVTGGSEKVQYYVMGSFLAEEGSYVSLENKKFSCLLYTSPSPRD